MTKEETFIVTGSIVDCMPNATFKVKLDDTGKINTSSNQVDKGKYYAKMPIEIHNKLMKKLSKNGQ